MIGTIISDGQARYTEIAWDPMTTEKGVEFQQPAMTRVPGVYGKHGDRIQIIVEVPLLPVVGSEP